MTRRQRLILLYARVLHWATGEPVHLRVGTRPGPHFEVEVWPGGGWVAMGYAE